MRFYVTFPQGLKEPSVQKVVAAFVKRNRLTKHEMEQPYSATSFSCEVGLLRSVQLVDNWLTTVAEFSHPLESDWPISWSVLVTERPMLPECEPSKDVLPEWVLVEFFDSVLLDADVWRVAKEHSPRLAKRSKLNDRLHLYMSRWQPIGSKDKTEAKEEDIQDDSERNLEDLRCGPNALPQSIPVEIEGFAHLQRLAGLAYLSVKVDTDRGVGGRNALVLLSMERSEGFNRHEMSGTLVFQNENALGLRRAASERSLVKHVLADRVKIVKAIAEPHEERRPQ